jgi:mRNA turnover protein 4
VVQVALGRQEGSSFRPGSWRLADALTGQRGLLFTNEPVDKVRSFFAEFGEYDYARAKAVATQTVVVPKGPLEGMVHSMTDALTRLGLPVELRKGVIHVTSDYRVCEQGEEITADAAQLLKIFRKPIAVFHIDIEAVWERDSGEFESFSAVGEGGASRRTPRRRPDDEEDEEEEEDEDDGEDAEDDDDEE